MKNRLTRCVNVGGVRIGGDAPVSVQTMTTADPHDAEALVAQIKSCAALGCDIIRLTIPDQEAAKTLSLVKKRVSIPIVSDIHFDYRCALAAIEAETDALRLNPGNIGSPEGVRAVAQAAKEKKIPIRIGVNLGSLEKGLAEKLKQGEVTVAEALCQSAFSHLALLEAEGFRDVVISAKASNVPDTIATYRLLSRETDCPLHIGVTEAGTRLPGTVRNAFALGVLLTEGIGNTIRVSLTDRPETEVRVGMEILRSAGLKAPGPSIVSCPTCGRTKVDLIRTATAVEEALEAYYLSLPPNARQNFPHVAVMGCVVNGPGEAKHAEIALCGGVDAFLLYHNGEPVCKIKPDEAVQKVIDYVVSLR